MNEIDLAMQKKLVLCVSLHLQRVKLSKGASLNALMRALPWAEVSKIWMTAAKDAAAARILDFEAECLNHTICAMRTEILIYGGTPDDEER